MDNRPCDAECEGNLPHGILITFEGGEGAGKSTHIRYVDEVLRRCGREVLCLREPGGTSVGEQIRSIVLDPAHGEIAPETELLLYETARAQIVAECIGPALRRGAVVLCDRFTDSTLAYQSFGRGLPRTFVEQANDFATQGIKPDRTVFLDAGRDVELGLTRATKDAPADRIEGAGAGFHERVRNGFLTIASEDPRRFRVVSSVRPKEDTSAAVFAAIADLFPDIPGFSGMKPAVFDAPMRDGRF